LRRWSSACSTCERRHCRQVCTDCRCSSVIAGDLVTSVEAVQVLSASDVHASQCLSAAAQRRSHVQLLLHTGNFITPVQDRRRANYSDERVSVSVCLSVCLLAYLKATRLIISTNCCVLLLLWSCCCQHEFQCSTDCYCHQ